MVTQCAVPSCKVYPTKSRPVKYYAVPSNKIRRQLWVDRCPFLRKFSSTQLYNVKICRKHFAPQYITETNRLTKDALPTEHLHETDLVVIPYDHNQVSNLSNTETLETLDKFSSSDDLSCNLPNCDFVGLWNSNTLCFEISKLPSSSKAADQTRNCLASISDSMPSDKIPVPADMLSNTETVTAHNVTTTQHLPIHQRVKNIENKKDLRLNTETVTAHNVTTTQHLPIHQRVKNIENKKDLRLNTETVTAHNVTTTQHLPIHQRVKNIENKKDLRLNTETVTAHNVTTTQHLPIHQRVKNIENKKDLRLCLTPHKRKLRIENRCVKAKVRLLKKKFQQQKSFNTRISDFVKKIPLLCNYGQVFVDSQLRLAGVASKGPRYTSEEKVFALSLYKLSPRFYNELRKHIALPCKSKITDLLAQLPLRPGINDFIFQHLADASKSKTAIDKQCVLLFDEMTVEKGIFFNFYTGVIEGFEDCGQGQRNSNVADKVLVFMLCGLASPWKIPIAFFFACDGIKKYKLKELIKDIVIATHKAGFQIRCTVSDQGPSNIGAVNLLKSDCQSYLLQTGRGSEEGTFYMIDGHKIFHIYDVPHLLKCFRNNFQKKDLLVGQKRAQWKHIEALYRVDDQHGMARSTKLTDKHINPQSYDKMKVKLAAQVFSRQVSTALSVYMKSRQDIEMSYCYKSSAAVSKDIENGLFTAEILKFINDLFDSLNGFGYKARALKAGLSINSIHNQFWNSAVRMLESMEFDAPCSTEKKPITLQNFVEDIKSIKHLWSDLKSLKITFLSLRRLNQDPLKNFFSQIRGHCGYNSHPNCHQFVAAFKTLLINNIMAGKSVFANCAADNDKMLGTIKKLIDQPKFGTYTDITYDDTLDTVQVPQENELQTHAIAYISGAVLRYLLPITDSGNCSCCKELLISQTPNSPHHLIEIREYVEEKHLNYPSQNLMKLVWECIYTIESLLPKMCSLYIYPDLIRALQVLDITWFSCVEHKESFFEKFWLFVIRMQVKQWCTNFNRRVHNIDSRSKTLEMDELIATKVTKGASCRSLKRRKSQ